MNASLHDSGKRTSIISLLNPQDVPSFPPPLSDTRTQPHHQYNGSKSTPPVHDSFNQGNSFSLRKAEWGDGMPRPGRLPTEPMHLSRYQDQPSHTGVSVGYQDPTHDSHLPRQRYDDHARYPARGQSWAASQQGASGTPHIPKHPVPHNSSEHGGGYPPQPYPPPYQQNGVSEQRNHWQASEREPARLVARGTGPHEQHQYPYAHYPTINSRNGPASYFRQPSTSGVYASPLYSHQISHQQLTPPQSPALSDSRQAKRRSEEPPDDVSAKAKKKARAKNPINGTQAPSKRGYNAKKRSVAAQIAAQNARLRALSGESASLQPEMQFARCMSNRYKEHNFPRCVACTRRWAGDTCRFQGIRFFLKDFEETIVGISFVESTTADGPALHFPKQWNKPLKPEFVKKMKTIVAKALLPTLRNEMEHLKLPEIIRRPRETDVRTTCDTCMTSIFSSSWLCRICGREACAECFTKVQDFTGQNPDTTPEELAAAQSRRERHAHVNPSFLSCTRRNEHSAKDFSPMSRFCNEELAKAIQEMEVMLEQDMKNENSSSDDAPIEGPDSNNDLNFQQQAHVPSNLSEITTSTPTHQVRRVADESLTSPLFEKIWSRGEPFVVTNVLRKFDLQWTPEFFISKYGKESCLILECQSDTNRRVSVEQFFSRFGNYEGRKDSWKLKDWPSSAEFKTTFPDLYEDFSKAVPVPDYVRRDGVMNMSSHFPTNVIGPDLGPKMYNAMASSLEEGSKGSTRLHMDMADALNVMTFASQCPDGSPGYAAWDLFRAEDSDKLRTFLKKRIQGIGVQDPIHSQQIYLDEVLRKELYDTTGVKSYRVYQRPGEAIFIPAGCAHQVANLADCIKVAIDFVSPENVARCEQLTQEFREQNQGLKWKEDVLQLKTMMWFAWLSCCSVAV